MGRTSKIDHAQAVDQMMRYFWRNGYYPTTVRNLSDALGVNAPSLYHAFGDKETMYVGAVKHYLEIFDDQMTRILATKRTNREKLTDLIIMAWDDPTLPDGCLVIDLLGEQPSLSAALSRPVNDLFAKHLAQIQALLVLEQTAGRLKATVNVQTAAQILLSVHNGLQSVIKDPDYPLSAATITADTLALFYQN